MKTKLLPVLIFLLLLTLTPFVKIPKVGATEDLRRVTPALSEDVPCEPMPENYTTEDYLDTTNPYSQVNPLGEETDEEGSRPLYVLVFGDEEEEDIIRGDPSNPVSWVGYARLQLERGDESLVANFGIDIRILDFLDWDSDNSIEYMNDPDEWDLCDELVADKGHYLRTWYDGEWWSNYVDAIIGITAQSTPADDPPTSGVAPSHNELNQGTIFVLLKWQVYWKDDNLVQHEVSHLYYTPDHRGPQPPAPCCATAYHPHYWTLIYEDLLWWVFTDVRCGMTSYSWCTTCHQIIQDNLEKYFTPTLTISASWGGTTSPAPGTYTYSYGSSVTVRAYPNFGSGFIFEAWILDGAYRTDNPITVTMNSDHTLKAYFSCHGGPPGGAWPEGEDPA